MKLFNVFMFHASTNAFQIIQKNRLHTSKVYKSILPNSLGGIDIDTFRLPTILNQNNLDDDDLSMEELYRRAKEEDEEWYNTFVRDVLGEDVPRVKADVKQKTEANVDDKQQTQEVPARDMKPKKTSISSTPMGESSEQSLNPNTTKKEEKKEEIMEKRGRNEMDDTDGSGESGDGPRWRIDKDTEKKSEPAPDKSAAGQENQSETHMEEEKIEEKDPSEDMVVQFTDMYDNVQRVSFSMISNLGYEMSDVAKLQSSVLELIIEDNIPLPEEGLPRRWIVPAGEKMEVKILKRKKKQGAKVQAEAAENERSYESPNNRREPPRRRRGEGGDERRRDRKVASDEEPADRRRRRRSDSYSPYKNNMRDNEDTDSLWMDIPTFKQYLRREADFRLMVLGPDWEDWVKGESDWRLDLYKKWLGFVENGVGDDIFEELAYAPPSERQRQAPPGRRIRKPRQGQEEEPRQRRRRPEKSSKRRPPPRRREIMDEDRPRPKRPRNNSWNDDDDDSEFSNRERRRNPHEILDDSPRRRRPRRGPPRSSEDYDPREYSRRPRRSRSRDSEDEIFRD